MTTAIERFKKEFGWVRKRLLEEFTEEMISVEYFDSNNSMGVAVAFKKSGQKRRTAIRLIDSDECCFDQTPENEEYLEKFIEKLKS